MKIVSYNVNGLRARVSPFRSLRAFLNSLDADIICLQETKIRRQELTADIAIAEGYESFFSCTRTVKKGRLGYSGVATFCRISSGTIPVAAEEGFTGLLNKREEAGTVWLGCYGALEKINDSRKQEILELDIEGRCLVTDHGHFVLFNIYGPNVGPGDVDRQIFKLKFYEMLQCRLESILKQGRRVIVVGDLNIAPFAIDSCDPGPNFENNPSRKWLRSVLDSEGGPFSDAFRLFYPDRVEAYTCWSQASGAEEFNYGTRIDLILVAGPCSGHCETSQTNGDSCNGFAKCGLDDCDILHNFKRAKLDSLPRWSGGRSLRLDGSDHAPVYLQLKDLPSLSPHEVPQLAARFMPELRGRQQSIVSIFQKHSERFSSISGVDSETIGKMKRKDSVEGNRKLQKLSQSSLRTFCSQKHNVSIKQTWSHEAAMTSSDMTSERSSFADETGQDNISSEQQDSMTQKPQTDDAAAAWGRLRQLMTQQNLPRCKGHGEPCVVRTVKKPGPNIGRGFYVCARAKGPASNPEARCDHFEWAASQKMSKRN